MLAIELRADVLLIDEAAGRAVATRLGVTPVGVLAVLRQAKVAGLIPAARPLLDRLRSEIRFFVSGALYDAFVTSVGEK